LGFDIRHKQKISLLNSIQAPQSLLFHGTECFSAGREGGHLAVSSAKVQNAESYTFSLPYGFMAWCLIKHSGKFALAKYK
jgi:hypothetical protein